MLPQILQGGDSTETCYYREPSLTYKVGDSRIDGKINKLNAVQQAINLILSTERYSNPIYDDNYGVELEQYIGADYGTLVAGIERTLQEALLQDDRITGVTVTGIQKSSEKVDACLVNFKVNTIYGTLEDSINVVQ